MSLQLIHYTYKPNCLSEKLLLSIEVRKHDGGERINYECVFHTAAREVSSSPWTVKQFVISWLFALSFKSALSIHVYKSIIYVYIIYYYYSILRRTTSCCWTLYCIENITLLLFSFTRKLYHGG